MISGLSAHLPATMSAGLTAHGVPAEQASRIAGLPAVAVLFAAFLGYNPVQELLGHHLTGLPPADQSTLTGLDFFPHLISDPFADGLTAAFTFAIVCCVIGAIASLFTGARRSAQVTVTVDTSQNEPLGAELAAVAASAGESPAELIDPQARRSEPCSSPIGTVYIPAFSAG